MSSQIRQQIARLCDCVADLKQQIASIDQVELPKQQWKTQLYTITGTNGINELGWGQASGINPPGAGAGEDIDDAFPGGPYGGPAPLPGHPNVPTQTNVVADFDESGTNTGGPDQWHYWGWVYVAPGETVDIRENDGAVDQGIAYFGECKGNGVEVTRWPYSPPYRGGQFATAVTAGFHFVGFAVHDTGQQSGVDVEWSPTGAGAWTNIPAARVYTDCPTVECRSIIECEDGTLTELDGTPIVLTDLDFVGCPPSLCAPVITGGGDGGLDEADVQALIPQPATALPIPDNEVDTAIRTGIVGTSTDYARADHNHPIRRQANPGDPVLTYTGVGNMDLVQFLDRWSDEESYSWGVRARVRDITAGAGWSYITVPTIAGFQQPQITAIGSYRTGSTTPQDDEPGGQGGDGAAPRGPYMGKEWHHWSSTRRIYQGFYRRDNAIPLVYVEFKLKYVRL